MSRLNSPLNLPSGLLATSESLVIGCMPFLLSNRQCHSSEGNVIKMTELQK